jgi:hypothetical protein
MIMVELISDDEDDDDLSNKAYEVKSFQSKSKVPGSNGEVGSRRDHQKNQAGYRSMLAAMEIRKHNND